MEVFVKAENKFSSINATVALPHGEKKLGQGKERFQLAARVLFILVLLKVIFLSSLFTRPCPCWEYFWGVSWFYVF